MPPPTSLGVRLDDAAGEALFSTFEVAAVALSTFLVFMISVDGRSNRLEGAQLVGAYVIMAISFYFVQ
jgi:Ca2+:H+ antiporter